jgi:general L-amino acid transport system substrate-binding protein
MKNILLIGLLSLFFNVNTVNAQTISSPTINQIKARDQLICGIHTDLPGFASLSSQGEWTGLDIDYCKAIAAAVLGDSKKVKYIPLNISQRFTALQNREIDVLARNITLTMTRDTQLGMSQTAINFYDSVGFMTHKKFKAKSIKDLKGATLCSLNGAWMIPLVDDYFKKNKINYSVIYFEKFELLVKAYETGRCNVYSNDLSQLAIVRSTLKNSEHVLLSDIAFKSFLGPLVRSDDDVWRKTVTWVHNALITAEELGVTSTNIDSQSFENNEVARLLGEKNFDLGKGLTLDSKWAYRIIKQVGNYQEIYERNVGNNSSIKLSRGINNLWNKGGLHHAPTMH